MLLDLLFPKKCIRCGKIGEYVCTDCFARISFDTHLICLVCGKNSIDGLTHPKCREKYAIDGAFCGVVYQGIVRKMLYQLKYKPYVTDMQPMLLELLYESLIQQAAFMYALASKPLLISIPLSKKRLRERGYNQAEIFARGFAEKFDLKNESLLQRSKETQPQFGLSKEERGENMKGAFAMNDKGSRINDKDKTAFLIDDILTTGSTLCEAAKVLKRNGFEKVWGVVLARE